MRVYNGDFSKQLTMSYRAANGLGANPLPAIREFVDEAQARAIIAALRQGVTIARNSIDYLTPTTFFETFLATTPLGWLVRWASPDYAEQLISDHKKAALKAVTDTVPLIDKLAGEWFEAAKTGVPASDGTATWTEWRRKALLIADALKDYIRYQVNASVYFNAPKLIADMVITTVNCATDPTACGDGLPEIPIPWWVKGIGVGAALMGGAYVYNSFFRR